MKKDNAMNRPIIDEIPFNLSTLHDPIQKPNKNLYLYITIGVLGCGVLVLIGMYAAKLVLGPADMKKLFPTCIVPTGFLQAGKNHYINVGERVFPDHADNFAMALSLDDEPRTVWIQEFIDESRTQFILKTEIQGLMFSIQTGPPGAGAEWGIAFVSPLVRAVNKNVVLLVNKQSLIAAAPAWPDGAIYLARYPDKPHLFWSSSPGHQISQIRLVQN